MSQWLFLPLYFLALYAGFLLPIPGIILAWREWTKREKKSSAKAWRRTTSQIGLLLSTLGTVLWIYIWVAEGRGKLSQQYYYGSRTMYVGVSGSLATIAVSALAEGKLRKYLVLNAVGLLCFFCFGAGEAI
jgi:hypothetical protein